MTPLAVTHTDSMLQDAVAHRVHCWLQFQVEAESDAGVAACTCAAVQPAVAVQTQDCSMCTAAAGLILVPATTSVRPPHDIVGQETGRNSIGTSVGQPSRVHALHTNTRASMPVPHQDARTSSLSALSQEPPLYSCCTEPGTTRRHGPRIIWSWSNAVPCESATAALAAATDGIPCPGCTQHLRVCLNTWFFLQTCMNQPQPPPCAVKTGPPCADACFPQVLLHYGMGWLHEAHPQLDPQAVACPPKGVTDRAHLTTHHSTSLTGHGHACQLTEPCCSSQHLVDAVDECGPLSVPHTIHPFT